MGRFWIGRIIKFLIFALIAAVIVGLVVMFLWNWLMPAIFGLKAISYLQALGLVILCWILFGGLRRGHHWHHGRWRHRIVERWLSMTPEEREKFREEMRHRWRHHHEHHEHQHHEHPSKPET